jgi:transcriptional regulator GlxA family with amidase domain
MPESIHTAPYGPVESFTSDANDKIDIIHAMHVGLVAADGCFSSALTSVIDIVRTAEAVRADFDPSIPALRLDIVGNRRDVTTGAGLRVPVTMGLGELSCLDVVVLPALGTMTASDTVSTIDRRDIRSQIREVAKLDTTRTTVAAACTGVFALAETGLLDRHRATTSWWLGPSFRNRYPGVTLDLDTMVVADVGMLTAGAAFAHIDLALTIVRRVSPALARHVAQLLVIDERPSQGAYLIVDHLDHDDPLVLAFERYARTHLATTLDVATITNAIGTSRRTIERRTRAALGMSPIELIRRLRVERATHLLRTTDQSIDRIAPQVGYANASTLRALLRSVR